MGNLSNDKRILLIDDDKIFVKAVALHFQDQGYEVVTAYDGNQGLTQFHSHHPPLIVLDVAMPGMNGFEVARAIRQHEATLAEDSHTMIVILTAHARSYFVSQDFEADIDSYLTKPILPSEIVKHINNLLVKEE